MKTVLLLLLLLAAATGPARALQCHVCTSASNCERPKMCQPSSRYCKTQHKVDALKGNLVEKSCEDACTPDTHQTGQVSSGTSYTHCCETDLCNRRLPSRAPAGALPLGGALPLALALGLLALLWAPGL
ncbi:lymphocyte antigen 6 family member D [Phyllostomus discolor]|uniref:Lymphocyte antigen 6 family member D n=1 Tax=Phyllostomus discolor TaxID=89673 RepID=A0A833ZP93_9CHIR|nr:lymphocyte antigen 6 family member D [Phyllostomus discolor]